MNTDLSKITNFTILDSFSKADQVLNHMGYKNIWLSISGGFRYYFRPLHEG